MNEPRSKHVHTDSPAVIMADIEGSTLTLEIIGREHFRTILHALHKAGFSLYGAEELEKALCVE